MHLRHLVALSYVRDHDACPQQELAEAFCMDANNVVLLLNELEQLGYVTRLRDPERPPPPPRRAHARGRQRAELAERAQEAIEDEVLQALDPDERAHPVAAADARAARRRADRRGRSTAPRSRRSRRRRPCGSARHADRHPRRRLSGEERRVDLVDLRELAQVGHVDRQAHAPARAWCPPPRRRPAGSPGSGAPARPAVAPDELAGGGVERDLARAEQQLRRRAPHGCRGRSPAGAPGASTVSRSAGHRPRP